MKTIENCVAFFASALGPTFDQMPVWIGWLLYLTLVASVVALLACAFQKLVGRRVSARLIYVIWILVCLRFVLFATPESPTSFLNLIQRTAEPVQTEQAEFVSAATGSFGELEIESESLLIDDTPLESFTESFEESFAPTAVEPSINYAKYFWFAIASVWTLVVAFLLLRLIVQAIGLAKLIRNSESATSSKFIAVQQSLKTMKHFQSRLLTRVRVSDEVDVPATVGLFWPMVLLPRWCATELSTKQLEVVLVHELVHVQRRDVLIQFISHLVMILHWFNPIARYVRNRIEEFREITCDQQVIKTCGLEGIAGTRLYAEAILLFVDRDANSTKSINQPEWIPGFVGGNKNFIRERILMMDQKKSCWAKAIGLVGMVLLVAVGFTSAQTRENKSLEVVVPKETLGTTVPLPQISFTTKSSVVHVPDGGSILLGNKVFRPDGTVWAGGKMVGGKRGRHKDKDGKWAQPQKPLSDDEVWKALEESNLEPRILEPRYRKPRFLTLDEIAKGIGVVFEYEVQHSKRETSQDLDLGLPLLPKPNTNRKVLLKRSPKPVTSTPRSMNFEGGYGKNSSFVSELAWDQAANYEFEVFQGKNAAMKKLLNQVIHPDSMIKAHAGRVPRVGVMGLDPSSWGNGTADADQRLTNLLNDPENGFRKVSATNTDKMSSTESVRVLSQEEFSFTGKQFQHGIETEFSQNYSVGTSIEFTPILKGTELSSAVKIENNSLDSIFREKIMRHATFSGDWKERPHLRNTEILQAVTVPNGSRFVLWATGVPQDSSAKKIAEDDALIVLVRPKLIRRKIPPRVNVQTKPIPAFVEGKLKLPAVSAANDSDSNVVAASHSEETLTPEEIAKRVTATGVGYDVKVFKVVTKELNKLLKLKKATPVSGQFMSNLDSDSLVAAGHTGRTLQLGKPDSERCIEFFKQLGELAKESKVVVLSSTSVLTEKRKPSAIRIVRRFPCEKGRVENGILIKEGFEDIQIGVEVELVSGFGKTSGELLTVLCAKYSDVRSLDGKPANAVYVSTDSKGSYTKRPGMIGTEMNTTIRTKPGNTVAQIGVPCSRPDEKQQWKTLILLTPRIVY